MRVVVVGGGFAGVKTALELVNKTGIQVTLIADTENFEYHGALYRTGTGRSPLEVVLPLRNIFSKARNVEVVLDRISSIDPGKKRLISESGRLYEYDKAVLAMGNTLNYFGLAGMETISYSLNTVSHTIRLRHELTLLFKTKSLVTIAIIGAGASGVELAGELQHFAGMVATRYNTPVAKVDVQLIEATDRVLPGLRPAASAKALKRLQNLGVKVRLSTKVTAAKPGRLWLDRKSEAVDLMVWTAGSTPVGFYASHPKLFQLEHGRVKVDQYLQAFGQENVYIVGDNAATPFSGMAQTALHDAKFLARNILLERDHKAVVTYRVRHPVYVVPIGPKWALMQTEDQILSGYRGWLVRRRADLAVYRNFEPYKMALKTWRKGNKLARF